MRCSNLMPGELRSSASQPHASGYSQRNLHLSDFLFLLLIEFVAIFLFFLFPGYLIPCWHAYRKYFVNSDEEKEKLRIQQRRPTSKGIRREIRLSLQSILIFSIMGTGLFQMYKAGLTGIYWNTFKYPLYYIPLSFIICLVVHDTLFYWSHRLMHWRPIFKYTHAGHHKSVSPTPWAIFAFQPAEAVLQFLCLGLIIIFVPMKPIVLGRVYSPGAFGSRIFERQRSQQSDWPRC